MAQVSEVDVPLYGGNGTYHRTMVDVAPRHRATLIEGEIVSMSSCLGTGTDERALITLECAVIEGQGCSFCQELLDTVNRLVS